MKGNTDSVELSEATAAVAHLYRQPLNCLVFRKFAV